jgi:hypothetical protein
MLMVIMLSYQRSAWLVCYHIKDVNDDSVIISKVGMMILLSYQRCVWLFCYHTENVYEDSVIM